MKATKKTDESGPVFAEYLKQGTVVKHDGKLHILGSVCKYTLKHIAEAAGYEISRVEGKELQDVSVLVELEDGSVGCVYSGTELKTVTGTLEFSA